MIKLYFSLRNQNHVPLYLPSCFFQKIKHKKVQKKWHGKNPGWSRARRATKARRARSGFFASHMVGFGYALCHRYVISALEASATQRRKNRPPVGLEVRKASRDISRGLDSVNIYADRREETNILMWHIIHKSYIFIIQ